MPSRFSVALGLALVVLLGSAPVASAATISGRVSGAKLPKAGKGISTVRAVGAKDFVIADVAKVRSGRYRLDVPAGRYWMFGTTTHFRGKAGVDRGVGKVAVRAGQRKSTRVSLKKRRRRATPRIPALPTPLSARASYVNVKYPAVWIQHFSVSGPAEYSGLRKGLAHMLTTDLLPVIERACNGAIVEREQLNWILAEQMLTSPSTGIPLDTIIAHNREVGGTLTVTGATATLAVTVKNVASGATRSVTRTGTADRVLDLEQSVVQEVARLICGDKPPAFYSGQASGSLSGADGSASQTVSWSGNVRLKYTGELTAERAGEPPGEYAEYEPESGSIHVIIDGTEGECSYHGETDVSVVPTSGEGAHVQQGVDEPTYALIASLPGGAQLPFTTTGPQHCGGGNTTIYPLAGRVFLGSPGGEALRSTSSALAGDWTHVMGPVTMTWAWSLAPQAG